MSLLLLFASPATSYGFLLDKCSSRGSYTWFFHLDCNEHDTLCGKISMWRTYVLNTFPDHCDLVIWTDLGHAHIQIATQPCNWWWDMAVAWMLDFNSWGWPTPAWCDFTNWSLSLLTCWHCHMLALCHLVTRWYAVWLLWDSHIRSPTSLPIMWWTIWSPWWLQNFMQICGSLWYYDPHCHNKWCSHQNTMVATST